VTVVTTGGAVVVVTTGGAVVVVVSGGGGCEQLRTIATPPLEIPSSPSSRSIVMVGPSTRDPDMEVVELATASQLRIDALELPLARWKLLPMCSEASLPVVAVPEQLHPTIPSGTVSV
jgi:hypothetical protein